MHSASFNICQCTASLVLLYLSPKFPYNWIILFYVLFFLRLIVFYYYITIIVIATYFAESDTTERLN